MFREFAAEVILGLGIWWTITWTIIFYEHYLWKQTGVMAGVKIAFGHTIIEFPLVITLVGVYLRFRRS